MEKLLEIGSKFGLEGKDLMKFVEEQQAYEREDRRKDREIRKLEVEREIEVKQLEEKRAHADYDQLKTALLKRYDFTEDGYRVKFRRAQPESWESPEQFIMQLGSYLKSRLLCLTLRRHWMEFVILSLESIINTCPRDLSIHLRERAPQNLRELAKIADQFLVAHGKELYTTFQSGKDEKPILKEGGRRGDYDPYMLHLFHL